METKKKESKNMEKFKSMFFQTGLIVALVIVLAAFEWKTNINAFDERYSGPVFVLDTDTIITIESEKKELKQTLNTTQLKITETETDQDIVIDVEDNQDNEVEVYQQKMEREEIPEVEGDEIILVPPVMPEFPGGTNGLNEFLGANLKYPETARVVDIQGTVYVSFVVEKDGSISNSKILRGIGGGCDEEALRVVKKMPQWNPGKNNLGRPIRVLLNLPISFVLKN